MPFTTRRRDDGAKDFESVRDTELKYIQRRRQTRESVPDQASVTNSLVGLALSGGGIRSATTNLGVLQALSRMGVLRLVDYLSTVSGGGYIGGCLSALLSSNRAALGRANDPQGFYYASRQDLAYSCEWHRFPFNSDRQPGATHRSATPTNEEQLVAHLRTHGDFLIARGTIFNRQALRAVGTLVGGVLATLVLTLLFLSVMTLLLVGGAHMLSPGMTTWNVQTQSSGGTQFEQRLDRFEHRMEVIKDGFGKGVRRQQSLLALAVGSGITLFVLVIFVAAIKTWTGPQSRSGESQEDILEHRLLTVAAGLLMTGTIVVSTAGAQRAPADAITEGLLQPFLVIGGAYAAALIIYVVVGLLGESLWSRAYRSLWGSYLAIALYGTILSIVFVLFPAACYLAHAVGVVGLLPPLASWLAGRLLMMEVVTAVIDRSATIGTALRVVQGVLVAALMGFAMIGLGALAISYGLFDPRPGWPFAIALLSSVVILQFVSVTMNLNRIGMHYFYRDRILETYLRLETVQSGGDVKPFMDAMEMKLQDLHGNGPSAEGLGNTAPYLLINAGVDLAGSRDLVRRGRKWGYFLFSKYFCGSRQTGFRETHEYLEGRTQLARALTISGVPSGTGTAYQRFFAQSFVKALFNIPTKTRKARDEVSGQWISNPRTNASERAFWPSYILREALGNTNEKTRLVHVSDGGNTGDNIGLYPLLERRCQVVIACDAEADPLIAFDSLTQALLDAQIDLGVKVDIDLSMIRPDRETGLSQAHCAIGRIQYPECPGRPNWLIYMKQSLTGNEAAHILNYKLRALEFPHESDADQSFDDDQFESYRALGDHIAEETFARWILDPEVRFALSPMEPEPKARCGRALRGWAERPKLVWDELRLQHSPYKAAYNAQFFELTQQLGQLEQLFLGTPTLRWYYLDCMDLPKEPGLASDGVVPINVIAMQIQLMEDTYFALRLDLYANARDNRGWMNLFRRWGRSQTFNEYFGYLQSNCSNDFLAFYCNYILNWGDIDRFPLPHAWDVNPDLDPEYAHPSALECWARRAPGLFQDSGRLEAREPRPAFPPVHPSPGQHGGAGAVDESRPPAALTPPPESSKE